MVNLHCERATSCCHLLSILMVSLSILSSHIATVQSAGLVALKNTMNTNTNNNNNNNNNQQAFNFYMTRQQQSTMLSPSRATIAQVSPNASSPVNLMQQSQPSYHQQHHQQQHNFQTSSQLPNHQFNIRINPYVNATNEILLDLRQQMIFKSIKFDEHFRNLLSASKLSLHNMFADTYGMMYEHNTEIFTGMFEGLEQYYANGQIKLSKSMENFFERLYQKIFQVYNSNKIFSALYLECATEQLAHLKPFKDVPEKLINEIRHVFVAARTFVQALNNGIDVIKNIISLGQPTQCINLINEKLLKYTQIVGNNQQASTIRPPCLGFCEQVIVRCVGRATLDVLSDRWKGYVVALNELAIKLSVRYNIETIIAPLDLQISEAIMNFQENAQNISASVFQVCGQRQTTQDQSNLHSSQLKPPTNRLGKRAANPLGPNPAVGGSHNNRHNNQPHTLSPVHQPISSHTLGGHLMGANLGKDRHPGAQFLPDDLTPIGQKSPILIDEIRNYILSTKSFWSHLPNAVCTSNFTLGTNASSLSGKKQYNCFQEPLLASDTNSDMRYRNDIHRQAERLANVRQKIEEALEGVEIEWGSSSDLQRRPIVTPMSPSSVNGRLPPTTTTTTTTTTTPDPEEEVEPESDPEEVEPNNEEGSGESEEYPTTDPEHEDPEESTTELIDPLDNGEDYPTEEPAGSTPETSTPPNTNLDQPGEAGNAIDQPLQPIIDYTSNDLITPPNQAGAQKSSQTSSKLVINNEGHLLFALLMSVALLIVTNFQNNNQLLAHKSSIMITR